MTQHTRPEQNTRPEQAALGKALRQALIHNDTEAMARHIADCADVAAMDFYVVRWGAKLGCVQSLEIALDALGRRGPQEVARAIEALDHEAPRWAAENGHARSAILLLDRLARCDSGSDLSALADRLAGIAEDHRHTVTARALRVWRQARDDRKISAQPRSRRSSPKSRVIRQDAPSK